jgi:BirA family biotin operon repressor/biotin-[acetyl-CoA-carboxylase] ligase
MMSSLDASAVRRPLSECTRAKLESLELFGEIASTNTYLMSQPAPAAGHYRVAIADHQTSGRGRHDRRWLSNPGDGLYLSLAYTFANAPEHLPALTLALGVGVIDALQGLKVTGVRLKWPNDIVALDGKLGGILTEVQSGNSVGVTIVAGIGINMLLRQTLDFGAESDWAQRAIDLNSIAGELPTREILAGTVIENLYSALGGFEASGLDGFRDVWRQHDWLLGREIIVDTADRAIRGIAAGVDIDGALLVDTAEGSTRVISGSILLAEAAAETQ